VFILRHKTAYAFASGVTEGARVRCLSVAHESWAPASETIGRRPDYLTIALVAEGSVQAALWDCDLPAGTLAVFPRHAWRRMATGPAGAELYIAYLTGPGAEAFVARRLPEPGAVLLRRSAVVRRLFLNALEEASFGDGTAHADVLAHLDLVLAAAARHGRPTGEQAGTAHDRFVHAKDIIDSAWATLPDVEAVARRLGVSHSYLCRLFRRHLDCTPQQYLQRLRITAAATEVAEGAAALADIAERHGFADQFSFSRAFKRVLGVSPTQYRAAPT
jgi:AraC-like DNA-binding protein